MRDLTIPLIITLVALVAALSAYRGIRRGGARYYTLEREAMLRRASFTLLASILLFLGAVGLMTYTYQQLLAQEAGSTVETEEGVVTVTPDTDTVLETSPPTPTVTPTPDPNFPTPTATPIICRAVVDGTAGGGLTLRDTPGGEEVTILPDGTIVSLLEAEPVEANGFTWRQVRTVTREEGWVVEDYLTIGNCN
ncbi:MAG: SH3 domain-containing protein [Candidatus Promineifilaceae bacterium]